MDSTLSWSQQSPARPKVLVVDDESMNIRLLHELLRDDFEIFMAVDGLQAIKKSQSLHPDLILLDVVMPGMDGYQVCGQLKSEPETADIPIIFVTSHFDESEEVHGFELGAADFIHKPINPVIIRARINNQIALRQQKEVLRSIALQDGLTGIANRRKFDEDFQTNWLQCARRKVPLSLLMIDIDWFKQYNDRYGHQLGDACLRSVASAIKNSLQRPCDLAARYGGEEFACLLPDSNSDGSFHIAEKILAHIRELNIEHLDSNLGQIVTVSIGIACMTPAPDAKSDILIEAADQQLYLSKRSGRAQINYINL